MYKKWPNDWEEQQKLLEEGTRNDMAGACRLIWQSKWGGSHSCSLPLGHYGRLHVSGQDCICGDKRCSIKICQPDFASK